MNSSILDILSGSNSSCKLVNESDLKSKNPTTFTATISGIEKVYNLFPGTVLFLGFYKNMGTVTVAVSNHEIIRYLNLKDIQIWNTSSLSKGTYIGNAYRNISLQFEYCTQWKGNSSYPVRIKNNLYFKQNPVDILNGIYTPTNEIDVKNGIVRYADKINFTPAQALEWSPTSIDNSDIFIEGAKIVGG